MTSKQYKLVVGVLKASSVTMSHEDLALHFSNGRTEDLKELDHKETQKLIVRYRQRRPSEKMKNKILSMAHEIRWELPDGKVDMERLNAWCRKYTPAHVDFNDIPVKDLPKVVSVFEKMYKGVLNLI